MPKSSTTTTTTSVTRREWLALSGGALATAAAAASAPSAAWAQAPKRGGTLNLKLWDPPHWDPQLTISYKTHIALTFTHGRLLKPRVGPGVQPGTFPLEGDLAESWSQPNETTYVFKLRRGVRWHAKPPVNGRELTADDVLYSIERFRTVKGNANAYMLASVDKVEALDKYTVRFTLKEPFAWFLDMLANPDGRLHRGQGGGGEVRRPQEGRGGDRHRAVDARLLPAECRLHLCPQSRATSSPGSPTSTGSRPSWTRTMPRASPPSSPASTTSGPRIPAASPAWTGCRSRTSSSNGGRISGPPNFPPT